MKLKKANGHHLTAKGFHSYQRVVEVAMNMIRTNGYSETTIQEICREAGIGIGTFYHYFRSKEEVLLAYLEEENKDLLEYYARNKNTSYRNAILATADHYVDMYLFKGPRLISRVYSMLLFSSIDIGQLSETAIYQILHAAYTQGQHNGEFSQEIPVDTFCNLALGEWFLITSLWCSRGDSINIREMVAEHFEKLLNLVSEPTRRTG